MCGRYALFTLSADVIREVLGYVPIDEHGLLIPRWNIAPTQRALVVRAGNEGCRRVDALQWGLVPSWAKDLKIGARCINARAESAATTPSFRTAFRARRCLVPASGFYEWARGPVPRSAYFVSRADSLPMFLAGLWESWTDRSTGEIVETFTILTTEADEAVGRIHDRMPIVLPRERWDAWLDPTRRDAGEAAALLSDERAATQLVLRRVGSRVGDVRNDDARCVEAASTASATSPSESKEANGTGPGNV